MTKFRHCSCGKRLKHTDKNLCEICTELKSMKAKLTKVQKEKSQCQTKNKELMNQVQSWSDKEKARNKSLTHWLKIKGWSGTCTEDYLISLLNVAKDHPNTLSLSYGRN